MGAVPPRGYRSFILDYYDANGQRYRPTVRAVSRTQAEQLFKQHEGDLAYGRPIVNDARKITYEDLRDILILKYEINRQRSIGKVRKNAERLGEFFGGWRAINISASAVQAYIAQRQQQGFATASINRELASLKTIFRLAVKAKLLSHDHVPDIPMLKEAPPRAGFFEVDQFEAVLMHLPPEIRPVALFGYETVCASGGSGSGSAKNISATTRR